MDQQELGYVCKTMELGFRDMEQAARVHKALSSPIRLQMLRLLSKGSYCVNEYAEALNIPVSTAALHVRILEEAGLIVTEQRPGARGLAKVCSRLIDMVTTTLDDPTLNQDVPDRQIVYSLPIGTYTDCRTYDYCGILSAEGTIGRINYSQSFFEPGRVDAQLMWFRHGYFEYRVSTMAFAKGAPTSLRISFEACSEVGQYNMDWPSDIYVSVNGHELGVWTCPGDFGDRRGVLTPAWWETGNTQYGCLKTWAVSDEGTTLDGEALSAVTLPELGLGQGDYFTIRIGVHRNALHVGGLNLFGRAFGDHAQDLLAQVGYRPAE